ncbi:MAG: DsrE family protein [Pseudomonadota bacterium]|nr:DsrE family protein [Pseudomonadota bacterium]
MKNKKSSKVLIILFTSDFYKYYYGLNLASSYKATNIDVGLFYTGYAINFLLKNWISYDTKNYNNKFVEKKMPSYLEMINLCNELEVRFFYCKTALDFLNFFEKDFLSSIKIKSAPLYQMISEYKNEQTIFI